MLKRALNHMVAPRLAWQDFLDLAKRLDCVGIEFRNDLPGQLFDGTPPQDVGVAARSSGLRILALAEVKAFDNWSDAKRDEAAALMRIGKACGAEQVSLIARNDSQGMTAAERKANLNTALRELKPLLEEHDLIGLIEPLGFESCALRNKSEVVEAIQASGSSSRFKIVHDTFHHTAAGGGAIFPEHTGIVHISGVARSGLSNSQLRDDYRGLVAGDDQIGNVSQLTDLLAAGYLGPVSFEPFAPEVHSLADPGPALAASFAFLERSLNGA